jgi:subfamily B ATP-binding cassette protein MsbA
VVITLALFQSDTKALSAGGFMAFITAMLMLIAPIKHLSEVASTVTRGLVAIERALHLLDTVHNEPSGTHRSTRALGRLALENIWVHYPQAEQAALRGVSLHIEPGEFVALVGLSGSGKSTLAQVLTRFVAVTQGRVLLDGVDLLDWDVQNLRQQFAFVGQNVVMLNDSLLANVTLGQPQDRARATQCMLAANLGPLLEGFPEGIDTVVGHNANKLSGGERQRLAIARALYKDAPILILDEVTSALDSDTERMVQDALRKVMAGRTTLAIAHRLSTIRDAHRIVVLQGGQIVQTGHHDALVATPGPYQDFLRLGAS